MDEAIRVLRQHPRIVGAVGAFVLLVAVLALMADDEDATAPPPTSGTAVTTTSAPADDLRLVGDIGSLDCNTLLTDDDVTLALSLDDREGPIGTLGFSRGEICTYRLTDDDTVFVTIQPGRPADLAPTGELLGVGGDPVDGAGDEARWFGGPDAEGGGAVGALSLRATTTLGELHVRLVLGRPDLDPDDQRDLAVAVAAGALTRFPGVEQPVAAPTFEHPSPDPAGESYAANVRARADDGEWTMAEGVAATLELLTGNAEPDDVLRVPELADDSGIGLLALAHAEAAGDGAGAPVERIRQLLDQHFPTGDELPALAEPGDVEAEPASSGAADVEFTAAFLTTAFQQAGQDICDVDYGGVDPCFLVVGPAGPHEQTYQVHFPNDAVPDRLGWTGDDLALALTAVDRAAASYEDLGHMPATTQVVFTGLTSGYTFEHYDPDRCMVYLARPMQTESDAHFQQRIAWSMAACMVEHQFNASDPDDFWDTWWPTAFAVWLSTEPYPSANIELKQGPAQLRLEELAKTVFERRFSNAIFFEYTEDFLEPSGNFELVETLPDLAAVEEIGPIVHQFAIALTDEAVPDHPPAEIPYDPPADPVAVSGRTELGADPRAFGTVRYHLTVDAGKTACMDYTQFGSVDLSWREGPPGDVSSPVWRPEPPATLEGEAVFVVTAIRDGVAYAIEVTDVVDDPEDCDEDRDGGSGGPDVPGCSGPCGPSEYYHEAD